MSKHKSDPKQTPAPAAPTTDEADATGTEQVEQPIVEPMGHHSPLDEPDK